LKDPIQTFTTWLPLVLGAFLAVAAARAYGVAWGPVLHWGGELLLVVGILLAAKGISDVRREWTSLPGITGKLRSCWNWTLKQVPLIVRVLHLRPFTKQMTVSVNIAAKVLPSRLDWEDWGAPPSSASQEERLAWLEKRLLSAEEKISGLDSLLYQESVLLRSASWEERVARERAIKDVREGLADLAGGGLRLQAWGVVCLLVGTALTAIW
jgi:hypothetical protein